MKRISSLGAILLLTACGGEEVPAETTAQAAEEVVPTGVEASASRTEPGQMQSSDWLHVNEAARTVHMTVTAGLTNAKNYWNFNGGHDGNMTITVPEGFTVTIDLVNEDPNMPHSLGISRETSGFGAMPAAEPAFEGAITDNPASMVDATMPGETETIQFVASVAGEYAMVCYIPGHAATGMWVYFNVSSDGSYGVEGG